MTIKSIVASLFAVYASGNRLLLQSESSSIYDVNNEEWKHVGHGSYGFVKDKKCESYGMVTIEDPTICQMAAQSLSSTLGINDDFNFGDLSDYNGLDRPSGCSYHKFGNVEQWKATKFTADCDVGNGFRGCFCEIAPKTEKMYIWVNELVNYETAERRCNNIGGNGQLATFESQDEYLRIVAAIKNGDGQNGADSNYAGQAWIGLNDRNVEHEWKMIDGDSSFCDAWNGCKFLPFWNNNEPGLDLTDDYGEDCAVVYGWGDTENGMNDISCDKRKNYVCEITQFF